MQWPHDCTGKKASHHPSHRIPSHPVASHLVSCVNLAQVPMHPTTLLPPRPPALVQTPPQFPHAAAGAAGQAPAAHRDRRLPRGVPGEPLLRAERVLPLAPRDVRGAAARVCPPVHRERRRRGRGLRVLPGSLRRCRDQGGRIYAFACCAGGVHALASGLRSGSAACRSVSGERSGLTKARVRARLERGDVGQERAICSHHLSSSCPC